MLLAGLAVLLGTAVTDPDHIDQWVLTKVEESTAVSKAVANGTGGVTNSSSQSHGIVLRFEFRPSIITGGTNKHYCINIKQPSGIAGEVLGNSPCTEMQALGGDWLHYVPQEVGNSSVGIFWGGDPIEVKVFEKATINNVLHTVTYSAIYGVDKLLCEDASIDSRTVYGKPNKAGGWEVDPNAPPENLNFGSYTYRGGLFAGFAPANSLDRSGIGRIQLWVPTPTYTPFFVACTLFHLGAPPGPSNPPVNDYFWRTAMNLKAAGGPSSTTYTESTATWGNKWTTTGSSPVVTLGDWNGSDKGYVNLQMTTVSSTSATYSTISNALKHIVVMDADEGDEEKIDVARWRYFASREFQALNLSTLYSDVRPRVWAVKLISSGLVSTP